MSELSIAILLAIVAAFAGGFVRAMKKAKVNKDMRAVDARVRDDVRAVDKDEAKTRSKGAADALTDLIKRGDLKP